MEGSAGDGSAASPSASPISDQLAEAPSNNPLAGALSERKRRRPGGLASSPETKVDEEESFMRRRNQPETGSKRRQYSRSSASQSRRAPSPARTLPEERSEGEIRDGEVAGVADSRPLRGARRVAETRRAAAVAALESNDEDDDEDEDGDRALADHFLEQDEEDEGEDDEDDGETYQGGMSSPGDDGDFEGISGAPSDEDGCSLDNDSTCFECQGGGELLCCDGCTRSHHAECVPAVNRPREESEDWFCPECRRKAGAGVILKKRGYEVPYARGRSSPPMTYDGSDGQLLAKGLREKKRSHVSYLSPPAAHIMPGAGSRTLSIPTTLSRRRSPSSSALEDVPISRPRRAVNPAKRTTEGRITTSKINIGPQYQSPGVPYNFLEAQEYGINYGTLDTATRTVRGRLSQKIGRGLNECRLVYSPSQWNRIATIVCAEAAGDLNGTSENNMVAAADCGNLHRFLSRCERYWPLGLQWQFSMEFALKLLHFSAYDEDEAIRLLRDPHLNFQEVCDPPVRPYMNKWRPKDRRGHIPSVPFPPPSYMSKTELRARMRQQLR